jgi:hypothetical protein
MDGYVEHTVTEAALNHTYPTNPKNPKYDADKGGPVRHRDHRR